MVCPF